MSGYFAGFDFVFKEGEDIYGAFVVKAAEGVVQLGECLRGVKLVESASNVPAVLIDEHLHQFDGETFYLELNIVVHSHFFL